MSFQVMPDSLAEQVKMDEAAYLDAMVDYYGKRRIRSSLKRLKSPNTGIRARFEANVKRMKGLERSFWDAAIHARDRGPTLEALFIG